MPDIRDTISRSAIPMLCRKQLGLPIWKTTKMENGKFVSELVPLERSYYMRDGRHVFIRLKK